jgi:multidrug efflux pump subunit AcrB
LLKLLTRWHAEAALSWSPSGRWRRLRLGLVRYSVNSLTLFGLVLAVGIVVDDAIVVVENVERHLAAGLAPREAALKTMREVGGALVSIALVLCAVFVPTAFLSGISGEFFRQFAVTIAVATAISAFSSLTLSPALASLILRPHHASGARPRNVAWRLLQGSLDGFNRLFDRSADGYGDGVRALARWTLVALGVFALLIGLTAWLLTATPKGFIPEQDRGYVIVSVQLPGVHRWRARPRCCAKSRTSSSIRRAWCARPYSPASPAPRAPSPPAPARCSRCSNRTRSALPRA